MTLHAIRMEKNNIYQSKSMILFGPCLLLGRGFFLPSKLQIPVALAYFLFYFYTLIDNIRLLNL